MNTTDVYNELETEGVEIVTTRFRNRTALISPDGLLAIDYSKIETEADEKEILLEEIGHFCTNAFYPIDAPNRQWEKQEGRAQRFVFEKYYPPECIAEAMRDGDCEPWVLAERFDLPERFVREMLMFYTQVKGVDFNNLAAWKRSAISATISRQAASSLSRRPVFLLISEASTFIYSASALSSGIMGFFPARRAASYRLSAASFWPVRVRRPAGITASPVSTGTASAVSVAPAGAIMYCGVSSMPPRGVRTCAMSAYIRRSLC